MKKIMSLGSKNPKKEINIELTKGKIFLGFIGLMVLIFCIIKILIFLGFGSITISCNDGSIEKIEIGKEYYCNEHYTKLRGTINNNQYESIENIIFNRSEEVEING